MQKLWKQMWKILTSMKGGIFLLISFAFISALGSVIPQESFAPDKAAALPPLWRQLGLTHLYHSFFYQVLVFVLSLNLTACSLSRFPKTIKRFRQVPPKKSLAQITEMSEHCEVAGADSESLRRKLEETLKRHHYQSCFYEEEDSWGGWARRGRFGIWGSFFVHLSFLILVLGMVIGGLSGFKGYYMTYEGENFPLSKIILEEGSLANNWMIRVNSAAEKFDAQGYRENWFTDLSILQDGQEVRRQVLSVNHPLEYQGITFYQSSFGQGARFIGTIQGKKVDFALQERAQNFYQLPGTELYIIADTIQVVSGRALVDYQILGKDNPAPLQTGSLKQGEQASINGVGEIALAGPVHFTGLVLKRDPGVPLIWLGSALLVLGLIVSFYLKPSGVWFGLKPGKRPSIALGLSSTMGHEESAQQLADFVADLQKDPPRRGIRGLEEEWQE